MSNLSTLLSGTYYCCLPSFLPLEYPAPLPPSLLGFICAGELTQMRIFEKRYQVSMCLYICLYIYLYICLYICLGGGRSGSRTLSLLIH